MLVREKYILHTIFLDEADEGPTMSTFSMG